MKIYSSTELQSKSGDVLSDAEREPVGITRYKKLRYILMSYEGMEGLANHLGVPVEALTSYFQQSPAGSDTENNEI